jgi:hypothetical protein
MDMKKKPANHYAMELIEEEGKIFVLFYDSNDNLVAKREIPQYDVTEAIRLNEENN